jgi:hypothetical protein
MFFYLGVSTVPKKFAIWLTIANIYLCIWSLHSFLHLHILSSGRFPLQQKICYLTDYSKHLFMCFKFVICFQYLLILLFSILYMLYLSDNFDYSRSLILLNLFDLMQRNVPLKDTTFARVDVPINNFWIWRTLWWNDASSRYVWHLLSN